MKWMTEWMKERKNDTTAILYNIPLENLLKWLYYYKKKSKDKTTWWWDQKTDILIQEKSKINVMKKQPDRISCHASYRRDNKFTRSKNLLILKTNTYLNMNWHQFSQIWENSSYTCLKRLCCNFQSSWHFCYL